VREQLKAKARIIGSSKQTVGSSNCVGASWAVVVVGPAKTAKTGPNKFETDDQWSSSHDCTLEVETPPADNIGIRPRLVRAISSTG